MNEDYLQRRAQAKQTLISAIRVIRDIQRTYRIPTSYVLKGFAVVYRQEGYYDSFRWITYAIQQIKHDESRGGR